MTIQAFIMLRKLKKAQITESGEIFIDYENLSASTVHQTGDLCVTTSLARHKTSLSPILEYLEEKDLISKSDPLNEYVQVKHQCWYLIQEIISAFCRFLVSSVVVPIFVAFITTLISLWITGVFTETPTP